jgi:ribosomal protein S18 acetylase RimI-like enzyme/rRNA-processing protein FCF1
MSGRKILIDTNVFIGLEDQQEVAPELAAMLSACAQHSVRVFVHEASVDDIKRDKDEARRRVSLSKINKFERIDGIPPLPRPVLDARFGAIVRPNDAVDVALLYALEIGAVDFLITEDRGIHARARRHQPQLANRTLTVADTLAWLRRTFEPRAVHLPFVQEVKAHAIPPDDEIFASLRDSYPNFDDWWRTKCIGEHRPCWTVTIGGVLAGLVVRKNETHAEAGTRHPGPKILKICTFKVKSTYRGEKLGELLLKQIIWFCQVNAYDLLYVTTFLHQENLIETLEYFGFEKTSENNLGEGIFEKPISRSRLYGTIDEDLFGLARINYPRFVCREPATAFCVPIRGEYHDVLFPEMARRVQPDLFQGADGLVAPGGGAHTPGNTIRKVYICRAQTQGLRPGSVLVFYRSRSPGFEFSQCITSVGVVEKVSAAVNLDQLVHLTAKRSAYTTAQLNDIAKHRTTPVKVIDFLLVGHLNPPAQLADLLREGVFVSTPPQSICNLPPERFAVLRKRMNFGFEV